MILCFLLFAICYGKYCQRKSKETGKTKLEELNKDYSKPNKLIALTINDIYDFLENYINEN